MHLQERDFNHFYCWYYVNISLLRLQDTIFLSRISI